MKTSLANLVECTQSPTKLIHQIEFCAEQFLLEHQVLGYPIQIQEVKELLRLVRELEKVAFDFECMVLDGIELQFEVLEQRVCMVLESELESLFLPHDQYARAVQWPQAVERATSLMLVLRPAIRESLKKFVLENRHKAVEGTSPGFLP